VAGPGSQFTNPLDVVKIRQQLDGELGGKGAARKYPNFVGGLVSIVREEGEDHDPRPGRGEARAGIKV